MKLRALAWLPLAVSTFLTSASRPSGQESAAFDPIPRRDIAVTRFTDQQVGDFVATLGGLLARHADPARRAFDVDYYVRDFTDRLQAGVLSAPQARRVNSELGILASRYPSDGPHLERGRRTINTRAIGRPAPGITGRDLDGASFSLADYRGKVVVLTFSGEWCGACRGEYPFQRLLLELYKDRPFALLGISSDEDPSAAKKAKLERGLHYRTWWDGAGDKPTAGPIATAWDVVGWPTVYVLDEQGTIRFVNLRQEDLLTGVRQLMDEQRRKTVSGQK